MSYILSALRKADRDRKRGDVPDILEPEMELDGLKEAERANNGAWVYWTSIVVFVAVINFLFIDWSGTVSQDKGEAEREEGEMIRTPADNETGLTSPQAQDDIGEARESAPSDAAETRGETAQKTARETARETQEPQETMSRQNLIPNADGNDARTAQIDPAIIPFEQLSASFRDDLPELELSGHLFSAARPQARKVIINGKSLREGDTIDDELRVKAITANGVVLNYEGILFELSARQIFQ